MDINLPLYQLLIGPESQSWCISEEVEGFLLGF
jgi:hypothetical protein